MNGELKPKTFRISEETSEKFKAFCSEFDNQNAALESLIAAYEISNAKHILTTISTDIADYQTHIDSIQKAFLHILELNNNAEERIRTEFKAQLNSKDKSIIQLQEQVEQLTETAKLLETKYQTLDNEKTRLEAELKFEQDNSFVARKEISEVKRSLADKDDIVDNLKEKIEEFNGIKVKNAELQSRATELEKELQIKTSEFDKKLIEKEREIEKTTAEISSIKKQLEEMQQTHKKEIGLLSKEHEADEKQAVLDEKEKYQTKIEKQVEKIAELNELIAELRKEISDLKAKHLEKKEDDAD